jgi:small conductance mechanosensitive channel
MQNGIVSEDLINMLTEYGLSVLGAIAVLIAGFFTAKIIRRWVRRTLMKNDIDETLIPVLTSTSYYLVLTFVVIAVLGLFGVQVTSIIAVLGAAAFAVGMALQGTLSNFASGIMLLVFRPFKVGDLVEVGGAEGIVQEIGIFMTALDTFTNVRYIVPNTSIWGATIKNYTIHDQRRNDLVVSISYSDDIDAAMKAILDVLEAEDRVLKDPEPRVVVGELGDSSVNLYVRPWCLKEDYFPLRFDLTHHLKLAVEKAGCTIPFPQRDVHMFPEKQATA